MAPRLWFTQKSVRRISLRSFGVLVGKAPTKQKRLKMLCTMPLTGQKLTGFPEWLADARDFVMKNGEVVKPTQTISYCNITMSDELLFGPKPIEAPKSKLSHFSIENMGSGEDPTCVLKFQILTGFSTDLNRWCGQMAGEEFDTKYEITEAPADDEEDELELTGDDEEEEDDEDEGDDALAGEEEVEDEHKGQARRRAVKQTAVHAKPPTPKDVADAKKNLSLM